MTHNFTTSLTSKQIKAGLTEDVRLERLRHEFERLLQVLVRALAVVQPERHSHALKHLAVVVDLERVVEREQVLVPGE